MVVLVQDKAIPDPPLAEREGFSLPALKRQFRLWAVFDFANSLIYTNVILYFSQWLTIERGVADFWYNLVLTVSTILLIVTAPLFATWGDQVRRRAWFLRVTAVVMVIGGLLIGSLFWFKAGSGWLSGLGIIGFLLINYSYQLSLPFYDAMLGDVSSREKYVRASGFGLSFGWIGAIVGILVVYPIAKGLFPLVPSGRLAAIGFATLLFAGAAIIPLRKLKEPFTSQPQDRIPLREAARQLWDDIKALPRNPPLFAFLIAYWIYIDTILTLEDNFPIYLERTFGLPDAMKAVLVVIIIVGGVIGALLTGLFVKPAQSVRILRLAVGLGAVGMMAMGLAPNQASFIGILVLVALLFGAILTISRSLYTELVPRPDRRSQYFGFYSIAERSSSIIGPLVWGTIVSFSPFAKGLQYRVAILALGVLMVVSLIPLSAMTKRAIRND